jgi:hypothetical protein
MPRDRELQLRRVNVGPASPCSHVRVVFLGSQRLGYRHARRRALTRASLLDRLARRSDFIVARLRVRLPAS